MCVGDDLTGDNGSPESWRRLEFPDTVTNKAWERTGRGRSVTWNLSSACDLTWMYVGVQAILVSVVTTYQLDKPQGRPCVRGP